MIVLLLNALHRQLDDILKLFRIDIRKPIDIETPAAFFVFPEFQKEIVIAFLLFHSGTGDGEDLEAVQRDVLLTRREADRHPFRLLPVRVDLLPSSETDDRSPHISGFDFDAFSISLEISTQSLRLCVSLIEPKNFATLARYEWFLFHIPMLLVSRV